MKHIENTSVYKADDGKTIIRKADNEVIGTMIDLGDDDSILNYEEIPLTEENDIEGILKSTTEKPSEPKPQSMLSKLLNSRVKPKPLKV